jgi:hypothetical protein
LLFRFTASVSAGLDTTLRLFVAALLVTTGLLVSCQKAEREIIPEGSLIERPGIYRVLGEDIRIRARVENGIVHYTVAKGEVPIIESTERASDAQRWFLCWDKQQRLWFHSSDIGGLMWTTNSNSRGRYFPTSIADSNVVRSMPRVVFDGLPSSIRAKLKPVRDE